ncbi:MAG: SsrA-binding protein SmpB [Patescibacteria group bacterium]
MKITNRKFHRDYQELEKFEAGIVLNGAEVKSVKEESLRLDDAFVRIIGNEAFLINADIPIYHFSHAKGYDPKRSRKLLLHKKEILKLQIKLNAGGNLTIAPISVYTKGTMLKVEIALAKGRKDVEKTKLVKQRDVALDQKREAKEYMKN